MDLDTATKDNWQEANETQRYNLADVSGGYSEESVDNTEMICKLLQRQAAPHVNIERWESYQLSVLHEHIQGGT